MCILKDAEGFTYVQSLYYFGMQHFWNAEVIDVFVLLQYLLPESTATADADAASNGFAWVNRTRSTTQKTNKGWISTSCLYAGKAYLIEQRNLIFSHIIIPFWKFATHHYGLQVVIHVELHKMQPHYNSVLKICDTLLAIIHIFKMLNSVLMRMLYTEAKEATVQVLFPNLCCPSCSGEKRHFKKTLIPEFHFFFFFL